MFLFFVFCKCCFLPHSSVSLTLLPRLFPFIYRSFFVLTVFLYCITFWPILSTSALLYIFTFSCLWVFSMATLNVFSCILPFALRSYGVNTYVRCRVHVTYCPSVNAASFTLLHFLKAFWSWMCVCVLSHCLPPFLAQSCFPWHLCKECKCCRKDQPLSTESGRQNIFFSFVFTVVVIGYIMGLFFLKCISRALYYISDGAEWQEESTQIEKGDSW